MLHEKTDDSDKLLEANLTTFVITHSLDQG